MPVDRAGIRTTSAVKVTQTLTDDLQTMTSAKMAKTYLEVGL